MNNKETAFLRTILKKILKDKKRDEIASIQRYLCSIILPNYDDCVKGYKNLKKSAEIKNFDEFLASIFEIAYPKIQTIMKKLNDFKNKEGDGIIPKCMAVKISI